MDLINNYETDSAGVPLRQKVVSFFWFNPDKFDKNLKIN